MNHSILLKKKEHSHHSYICRIFLFPFRFLTYDKYTVHFSCFCVSQIRLHFCFSSQWFGGAPFLFSYLFFYVEFFFLFGFQFFFFGTLASLWFVTAGVLSTTGDQPAPRCCFSFLRPSLSPLQTQPIKNTRKKIINTCICSVLCVCFPFFFVGLSINMYSIVSFFFILESWQLGASKRGLSLFCIDSSAFWFFFFYLFEESRGRWEQCNSTTLGAYLSGVRKRVACLLLVTKRANAFFQWLEVVFEL